MTIFKSRKRFIIASLFVVVGALIPFLYSQWQNYQDHKKIVGRIEYSDPSMEDIHEVFNKPTAPYPITSDKKVYTKVMAGELEVEISDVNLVKQLGSRLEPLSFGNDLYIYHFDTNKDVAAELATIQKLPGVKNASPNYVMSATNTTEGNRVDVNDPFHLDTNCFHRPSDADGTCGPVRNKALFDQMTIAQGWKIHKGGAPIAVLDTGLDLNHDDLSIQRSTGTTTSIDGETTYTNDDYGLDCTTVKVTLKDGSPGPGSDGAPDNVSGDPRAFKTVANTNLPQDNNGHGTWVGSLGAAKTNNGIGIAGISGGSPMIAVKVMDDSGHGNTASTACGIAYAVARRAAVINMSLAGDQDPDPAKQDKLVPAQLAEAEVARTIPVAATGNNFDGTPSAGKIWWPAQYSSTVAVHDNSVPMSDPSTGRPVDVAVPAILNSSGGKIGVLASAAPGNSYNFGNATFSSQSTGMMSGAISVIKAIKPDYDINQVKAALLHGSQQSASDPNRVLNLWRTLDWIQRCDP
jgi:hypothetical protein